jgi:hypothetical protein
MKQKKELLRIKPLTSRFPLRDLELDFFARKFQVRVHENCKTVHCVHAFQYILLLIYAFTYKFR